MTDIASHWDDEEERRKHLPPGEAPKIPAPDIEQQNQLPNTTTDKQLADEFIAKYRHLFCRGDGRLFVFLPNCRQWVGENIASHIHTLVMHMSADLHEERRTILRQLEAAVAGGLETEAARLAQERDRIQKRILYCERGGTIGAVNKLIQVKLGTLTMGDPVQMNPDPALLACKNGVVDLRTGELRWAVMEDRITQNTGVVYRPDADTSWWKAKIEQIAQTKELAEFLQVWFGYCATAYTSEHCMAVMWGNGRNGKNLIMDAVAGALGGYAKALSASFLESQDKADVGNNILYMMAQLAGARMAYVSETGERGRLRESLVKSLTGDKTVRARFSHQDFFEFKVTHKFIVGTNHKPEISGTDDGVWERIRLIPMTVKFGDEAEVASGVAKYLKDVDLGNELEKESRREEVLRWIVEGATKYLTHGMRRYLPVTVVAETKSYRREQDVLGQFLQQVSVHVPLAEIDALQARITGLPNRAIGAMTDDQLLQVDKMDLWRAYALWAADNGHGVMSSTMFARRVTSAQRFWPGDGTGEEMMRPLEALRTSRGQRYRWFRWSEYGLRMRDRAQREANRKVGGHEHEEGRDDPPF